MRSGSTRIIDTNILLVANKQHDGVSSQCILECVNSLDALRKVGVVVLDDAHEILREYMLKTTPNTGNRVGDAFLKWLLQNTRNARRVKCVHIEPHQERGYAEFPEDDELSDFDRADRKFVAVAAKHPKRPPILQAADSKWKAWSPQLAKHGISIQFLCPQEIDSFLKRKRAQ